MTREKVIAQLRYASAELKKFNSNKTFIHLSQSAEKIWVAFTLLVELKSGKEAKRSTDVRNLAFDLGYRELYYLTKNLHIIHYKGSPDLNFTDIVQDIIFAIKKINKLNR